MLTNFFFWNLDNAGVANCVPFFELTKEKIKQTFDVNVLAQFWFIKQLLPMMIERKRGHIVAISSVCGLATNKNLVDYWFVFNIENDDLISFIIFIVHQNLL